MERQTRQHQAIFEAIASADCPLLAQEIQLSAASQAPSLSMATVYRNIKALLEEQRIKAVLLPGQNPRYELANRSHHHHFQCRSCEKVFDIESCPGNLANLAPSGFSVEEHEITLYGRCRHCVAASGAQG